MILHHFFEKSHELSPAREQDYEIYRQLVTGAVDEVGFYAVKSQMQN